MLSHAFRVQGGNEDLSTRLHKLMDAWCERRAIKALGHFLPGYVAFKRKPENMLPLAVALQDVAHFENEVLESEKAEIISLLGCVRSFTSGGFRM